MRAYSFDRNTTWNATSILTAISKENDVQVYPGAALPLSRPPLSAGSEIHGASGLDGTDLLPQPLRPANPDGSAVAAMAKALGAQPPGTAWLVATGALTNVAQLFEAHPELVDHLAGVSYMGGAVGGGFTTAVMGEVNGQARIGNTTPFAEFNILLDPEAAAAVFHNPRLAQKTTLIPLDVTHLVLATPAVQDLLLHGPAGSCDGAGADGGSQLTGKTVLRTMLVQLLNFFADTYKKVFGISSGPPLHDPLAVAAVLTGTAFEIPFYDYPINGSADKSSSQQRERYEVRVVTSGTTAEALLGQEETGRTVVRLLAPGTGGVRIPRGLDVPLFWQVLEECCTRADEANAQNGR
ncbi:uridine nucleosidase [Niveomyces insectorum RCEF 264]|uniref:Uridine nucleosidase n=1 Tax=Niveomyces insectorum RCEF 264 TaxID=1081102 RepID=A0A162LCH8_9HYPO|nr:uridine nucleosidase [Niveomyces insectorum RCEF 264]